NPQAVSSESVGPYSVQRPQAGLYMTKAETAALKRLGGRGGAFTVDPTPEEATPAPTWPWDMDGDGWADSRQWHEIWRGAMPLPLPAGETVVLLRRTQSGRDGHGNPVWSTAEIPVAGCAVWPTGSTEQTHGQDQTSERLT